MNGLDQLDPLGEDSLRRALRLEADDRAPRLDALAIAAAAERHSLQEQLFRAIRGVTLVGAAAAIQGLVGVAAFAVLADLDLAAPMGVALSLAAAAAERVVAVGSLTASPAVGLAALAAILFATLYERTGRESIRVSAS